jgi:hypothetical protein
MQIQGQITIGRTTYAKGAEIPWYKVYPFFLLHMLVFGLSGFAMAYSAHHPPRLFLYAHGGFAIFVYTIFYVQLFGWDEVKWMFINAVLGILGISSQIDWLLSYFGKSFDDYPWYVHVIPFLYYVLYTFLLRHAAIDLTGSRGDPVKQKRAEYGYIALSVLIYLLTHWWETHR